MNADTAAMLKEKYPTQAPAHGGWYFDEKAQGMRFLMPPMPGWDDCVKVDGRWAYRRLVERDAKAQEANDGR